MYGCNNRIDFDHAGNLLGMIYPPLCNKDRTTQVKVKAALVKTVTNDLPAQEIAPVDQLPHLSGLGLADPSFHTPGRIDILLGADVYPQLMLKQPMATGSIHDAAAQQTIFGWAIVGPVRYLGNTLEWIPTYFAQCQPSEDDQLTEQLAMFWKTEEPEASTSSLSSVEEQVQAHYSATTTYSVSPCRYQLTLPRRDDVPPLGESRSQALCRYIANPEVEHLQTLPGCCTELPGLGSCRSGTIFGAQSKGDLLQGMCGTS